ncbi:inositol monophosphatase [Bifidobacterium samirii]|uniref:Inositol-1-monophosphatase n=1 Tax=Bifidobacterium samirii TaxID=2306974 RepID=A0A430FW17_9BIFI|nr:inositol monophosphatase [Bifidobacterium samirii]
MSCLDREMIVGGGTVSLRALCHLVHRAADLITVAGAHEIVVKGRADYATRVDLGIQTFLRTELAHMYPQVQFLGEERHEQDADLGRPCWVVDPIDGTTNLIHDYRFSAISLALLDGGEPVMAVVFQPFSGEMFTACLGCGAFLGDRALSVAKDRELSESLVAVGTSPYDREPADVDRNFAVLRSVFDHCADIRRSGSATLDMAWVAAGRVDAYCENNVKLWDYAAAKLLITEAGGIMVDYQGRPIAHQMNTGVIAGSASVVQALLNLKAPHLK